MTIELDEVAKSTYHKHSYRMIFSQEFYNRDLLDIIKNLEEMYERTKRSLLDEGIHTRPDGIDLGSHVLIPQFNIDSLFKKSRLSGYLGGSSFKVKKSLLPFLFNELKKYINSDLCTELRRVEGEIRKNVAPDYVGDTYSYLLDIEEVNLFNTETNAFFISGKKFRSVLWSINEIERYLNEL